MTVLWLVGLSLIAVAAVAIFGRQQIAECWYIYRLGSDDSETVDYAARRLAEMSSTRAIMPLIEQIVREVTKGRKIRHENSIGTPAVINGRVFVRKRYETDSAVLKALYDLGACVIG